MVELSSLQSIIIKYKWYLLYDIVFTYNEKYSVYPTVRTFLRDHNSPRSVNRKRCSSVALRMSRNQISASPQSTLFFFLSNAGCVYLAYLRFAFSSIFFHLSVLSVFGQFRKALCVDISLSTFKILRSFAPFKTC